MSNPLTVADSAVRTAQRRRVGRVAVMISGAALAVTLWIVAVTIVIPALEDGDSVARSTLHTETMQLSCLSPQQAADIISPYVRSRGSIYYVPSSGIGAITVRGTLGELSNARDIIRDFESDPSAACRLPMTIVKRLQDQMSGDQGRSGDEPAVAADKATTSLLGTPGKSLLDQGPSGSGPVTAPKKATPPPKKQ